MSLVFINVIEDDLVRVESALFLYLFCWLYIIS